MVKQNQKNEQEENNHIINAIKEVVHYDINRVLFNKRKKDRMTYTLYHELGHLSKAIKEGFSLTYMRIYNRIIYCHEGEYFTIKIKNKNPIAGGCSIIQENEKEDNDLTKIDRFRSVVLAGGEVTESVLDLFGLSRTVSRKILELYPVPYSEENPKFLQRSNVVGTDAWLYMSLKSNPDLAESMFDIYEEIARYIETNDKKHLQNCGFLKEEVPNIQFIHKKKGESLKRVHEKIVKRQVISRSSIKQIV